MDEELDSTEIIQTTAVERRAAPGWWHDVDWSEVRTRFRDRVEDFRERHPGAYISFGDDSGEIRRLGGSQTTQAAAAAVDEDEGIPTTYIVIGVVAVLALMMMGSGK